MTKTVVMTEKQAADYIGYAPGTLAKWRLTGRGPKYLRISATSVRYRQSDIDEWLDERVYQSTSEEATID